MQEFVFIENSDVFDVSFVGCRFDFFEMLCSFISQQITLILRINLILLT
jgi:hypothetical protein